VHVGLTPLASSAAALAASAKPAPPAGASTEGLHIFKSPMVGTFYRAPSPEAAPFISVGDKIDEHTTVCIIEAMKVMNEITPDKAGEIVSIEVENGEAVEFGQPLFLIRPA
jgi:acetyl-CoA carboxylase biotin carboxyl carrier protein